ncbi:OmpP1/FadL family transporter [Psychrobacter piechaudii]|uniref:Outer membrane protein transport protein (OMPP1/FadL/TodX) n=1 Tax=Psychrobacter piechaudii TaxID=1945521 RepID=A0A1R4G9H9_9GAMM|nr:outer membrane protein transport protein [Psychrobacter piechaudii]SJM64662.1 Outer membrane protein transport protein (OMPP1/FadL/TodX) [Psychrobacter piechaudii]
MRSTFIIKPLVTAVAALSVASVASAAGLDRSGQDISAFLQDGTYAETVYTYIDADVTGHDLNADGSKGKKIKDIAEDYDFFRYGVKTDIDDTFSIGVLYDEPWGAAADYHGDNSFVGAPTDVINGIIVSQGIKNPLTQEDVTDVAGFKQYVQTVGSLVDQGLAKPEGLQKLQGLEGVLDQTLANNEATKVEVRSESLTALMGMKFGQNKQFQVYGGPVAQRLKADVKLRGDAYDLATGYNLNVNADTDYGWIAGLQYSKPEIALKAALTYRSEIDHSVTASEFMPLAALTGANPQQDTRMEVTTPESVNFDFQTGINPTTLATAKVRWVPWNDFAITPPLYNEATKARFPKGLDLVSYDDDQWQVELGLAKRVADNLAVSGTVGWDSGAGNPVTSLGPIEGYYSVGLGAKYDITKNWAVSAGGKYLMFGDAKGQIPSGDIVSKFEDNDGFALGVKLSYQDK